MTDSFEDLIGAIYQAGSDPRQWHETLALLARQVGGNAAALHVSDTNAEGWSFGVSVNYDPAGLRAYEEHFYKVNPYLGPLLRLDAGAVAGHHELAPSFEYKGSEFQNDYSRRYDIEGSVTSVLVKTEGQIACCAVTRTAGAEPFSKASILLMQKATPHLRRAVEMNRQLASLGAERDAAHAALDRLDTGVIFLDELGTVVRANPAGEALLKEEIGLTVRRRRLLPKAKAAHSSYERLLHDAVHGKRLRGGSLALPRGSDRRPLIMRLVRYDHTAPPIDAPNVRVIAFIRDPDTKSTAGIRDVAAAYGLTVSEARLVDALASGASLNDAADAQQISIVTARNHLARAMRKTETNRQGDLIRVILKSVLPTK